jgi:hypothetical protein
MNVREIIKEAVTRVNLVPRRQAIPGDLLENAYRLLKGVVNKYNYDNLLNFTQNSVIVNNAEITHLWDETDIVKGKNNMYFDTVEQMEAYTPDEEDYENETWAMVKGVNDYVYIVWQPAPGVFAWHGQLIHQETLRIQQMREYLKMQHVQIRDVAKINSIYLVTPKNVEYAEHYELKFVPAYKFDNYYNDASVYTLIQKSEGEWLIQLKPNVAKQNYRLKINYNESLDFDLDDDLYIPDNYVELLIVALAHKLALEYPRLDETQMERLQLEVQTLVDNVRTPKAVTRMILREPYDFFNNGRMTQNELISGGWL